MKFQHAVNLTVALAFVIGGILPLAVAKTVAPPAIAPAVLPKAHSQSSKPTNASTQSDQNNDSDSPTFKLNASKLINLPPAMYGTWNIRAEVIRTTAPPWLYSPATIEIWSLDNTNGVITLRNVSNNASATITVDNVHGNTATFHHVADDGGLQKLHVTETPTVTVDGDRLMGVNHQDIQVRNIMTGSRVSYTMDISLDGTRISGGHFTFHDPVENPVHFEVVPLQHEK